MPQQRYGMMTLNYSDIFFGFNFDEDEVCTHFVKDHLLLYVYDGELTLVYGNDTKVVTNLAGFIPSTSDTMKRSTATTWK